MDNKTANRIDNLLLSAEVFSKPSNEDIIPCNFTEEVILITGAAGSIGSALAKQLTNSTYKKLVLVDIAESPLYELIKDLENQNTLNMEFVILNITDEASLKKVFEKYKPTILFHAAAYKHVPLMESNPFEAVKLNIFGTKLLADLAITFKVKKFIFISTDKAVNPISIMGLTKLIAEHYLNFLSENKNTKFLITRFGNILGSNGSVVPLLKKQIDFNLPLTVTNKEISRYFISKESACALILKIAETENSSNTFTFNMGEPIKIIDLAKRMIHLAKLNENYPIKITGLRPGEKLNEEIINNYEKLNPSKNPDIFIVENSKRKIKPIDFSKLNQMDLALSAKEIKDILYSLL
ncbi:SDR family NAD(P)-dependent oxidoreductase [Neotamlana nanhaiensis]|uniref:SDR family NAD(P)-dependent oxidoreductase n=1 Tax=Neotamlana nanhaiensis TaxID=1382798 RepID=UPI00069BB79A|nr:SDR family NAD(P)-dependent oxidoreductase [Tamlana nanhaiensis]